MARPFFTTELDTDDYLRERKHDFSSSCSTVVSMATYYLFSSCLKSSERLFCWSAIWCSSHSGITVDRTYKSNQRRRATYLEKESFLRKSGGSIVGQEPGNGFVLHHLHRCHSRQHPYLWVQFLHRQLQADTSADHNHLLRRSWGLRSSSRTPSAARLSPSAAPA